MKRGIRKSDVILIIGILICAAVFYFFQSNRETEADALSTTCFALGAEEGMKLINSLDYAEAVFITDQYKLLYSDNFPQH